MTEAIAASPAAASAVLQVEALRVAYGGIEAVKGVSLSVQQGELLTLIGSNGAGKTTALKAICGLLPIKGGDVQLMGRSIKARGPWSLVRQGLVMVPEGRGIFTRMSIAENLHMGAYTRSDKAGIAQDIERMYALFGRLYERRSQLAGTLSGGEQQMLAIARGLMARPRVLLLDEPSLGLAPIMVEKIFDVIQNIHAQGATIVLVEQNASLALSVANRACVMESGLITMSGPAESLQNDAQVRAAYLGS